MSRRALFLDRDGVINRDFAYVYKREDFEFVDGIFELCQHAVVRDYLLVVVTNQAGIGRGYYTEADFAALTDWMCGEFAARGAPIAAVYFCPYHPVYGLGEYRKDSYDRKPNPGMFLKARDDLDIDLRASCLIGDKESDIVAGSRAGIDNLVLFGEASLSANEDKTTRVAHLEAACDLLV